MKQKGLSQMRVCDVVLNSIWYDPRVRKQIIEYQKAGMEVVCVGYKCNRYDPKKVSELPCLATIVDIKQTYKGSLKSNLKKLLREFHRCRMLKNAIIAQKPDIIHTNDLDTLAATCQAAQRLKCKVIYDSHEICTENNNMRGSFKILNALCEKKYIKKVDQMVCVSHAASDYFAKKYGIASPLVITNCALKSEQVTAAKKNPGFEVLNHGQYYAGRGYDIMIEAIPYLKEYPEIKLALRGFGAMEGQLRERAAELGNENVCFYPKVLVNELIPSAASSMVGVAITEDTCLNFRLSVSNKLFEYASAGLPVIMSDIPEHRYLNNKYHLGIILTENTPLAFADAAIKLYSDKAFYTECAENAKKMSEEINWETEFSRLIDIERNWTDGAQSG